MLWRSRRARLGLACCKRSGPWASQRSTTSSDARQIQPTRVSTCTWIPIGGCTRSRVGCHQQRVGRPRRHPHRCLRCNRHGGSLRELVQTALQTGTSLLPSGNLHWGRVYQASRRKCMTACSLWQSKVGCQLRRLGSVSEQEVCAPGVSTASQMLSRRPFTRVTSDRIFHRLEASLGTAKLASGSLLLAAARTALTWFLPSD